VRFETLHPLRVGAWCAACLLTTLRDDAEIDSFLTLHEDDEVLRRGVIYSLYRAERRRELDIGLESPCPAREMPVLPFE
jgi:hypothetical protein